MHELLVTTIVLCIISIIFVYIISTYDNGNRIIYDTAFNLKKRLQPKCLSCSAERFVNDFCKRHQGEYGCPLNTSDSVDTKGVRIKRARP